jgi:hypothetical protein
MSAAERAYRLLLRAYPPPFRAAYGHEMMVVFRDQRRERAATGARFWAETVWDVARSAPALRAEAWRARWSESSRTLEGSMKIIAMLTVVLGAFGALNALAEGITGTGSGATLASSHLLAIVLGGLAGAALLTAGVALLRRTPSSRQTASLAALAALVVGLITRLVHPWMSIFSQLVAVALPIVLLAALYWPRRRGPSAPGTA